MIMFKVLIVDDEKPVRDAIKILGEWDKLGIGSIIETEDGKSGIGLVYDQKPDIIFVDMRMPEMNGIEFLQEVEREYPEISKIVISGYYDFEFTRQAIKSNVVDYLLKPVNREELNNALAKAVDGIKERREKQSAMISKNITLNMSLPILKEKVFLSMIEGNFNKQMDRTYLRIIGAEDKSKNFVAVILRIMNLEEVSSRQFNNDTDLLFFAMSNIINEISGSGFECFGFKNSRVERELIMIITYDDINQNLSKGISGDVVQRWIFKLKELYGITAAAGIGGTCSEAVMLCDSYKSAEMILNSMNLAEIKDIVCSDSVSNRIGEHHFISNWLPLIRNSIENGTLNYIRSIIGDYLHEIRKSGYFSLMDGDKTLKEFIFTMHDILLESGVPQSEILEVYENSIKARGAFFDFSNLEDFENRLYSIMDYFCSKIRQFATLKEGLDVYEIKNYIDKNYFKEIKISTFTDKFYLSREYLMKLFKHEFGFGIYEYVQKVRMEKAKELLNDDSVKIQNVSQILGYSEHNYFSKAFKKYYGVSPTDYRSMSKPVENNTLFYP